MCYKYGEAGADTVHICSTTLQALHVHKFLTCLQLSCCITA